ncbi:Uncharacterised protein [Mycobacteroides abscessus]|nr:Uncharacterised protein [Mycobacteroides abscessus]
MAITLVSTMIGMGQRTTDVPTLRQPVVDSLPRGSRSPNLEATVNTAGANVSAAATITSTEIAHGSAMLWKYGSVVMVRHRHAPTMVRPDPRMTCETP